MLVMYALLLEHRTVNDEKEGKALMEDEWKLKIETLKVN